MSRCFRCLALLVVAVSLVACGSTPQRVSHTTRHLRHADLQEQYAAALELMKSGDLVKAEEAFKGLLESRPSLTGPLVNLGIIQAKKDQADQALAYFERALTISPRNSVALNWKGHLMARDKGCEAALSSFSAAVSADAEDARARLNLGILYDTCLHNTQAAIEHYQRYQEMSGGGDLVISAWIAELKASSAAPGMRVAGGER